MAYWDAMDSRYLLLRRWLNAFRGENALTGNEPDKAWRPLDSENNILAKLLRSYCEAAGLPESDLNNYRFNDTENDLYRKILNVIHKDDPTLPSGPELNWRPLDSDRDLLAKILRCRWIQAGFSDPQANFMPGDSEVWCLRKIVAAQTPAFSEEALNYFARLAAAGSSPGPNAAAMDTLIRGLKAQGLWSKIRAACLLAGPDSLAGALVPLAAGMPSPTNFNFVAGDYSRPLGLLGNGTSKYLGTNRSNAADAQDNQHIATWASTASEGALCGVVTASPGVSVVFADGRMRSRSQTLAPGAASLPATGFYGVSRAAGASYNWRSAAAGAGVGVVASNAPVAIQLAVFARRGDGAFVDAYTASRLAFYSIGEALDLAALDALVSAYVAALA